MFEISRNRLDQECSPYLLQHKDNPVWWQPWDKKALSAAKKQNKPIFLSIGYSTCHWCHVMENESFEDEEVAKALNDRFIAIKVDREERPDLDDIYMTAVQMITGHGGWPMSVWLTPDLKPFFGGTYFPKDRFIAILERINQVWGQQREHIVSDSQRLTEAIKKWSDTQPSKETVDESILMKYLDNMENTYDPEYGGFSQAPKFPETLSLMTLMRIGRRSNLKRVRGPIEKTLQEMCRRGLFDHLNGGFHRYSTDRKWKVPHFEKMLYDNALLSLTYLEAFQLFGNEEYELVARKTLDYVLMEMTDRSGGFYSAQDADSLNAQTHLMEEGFFATWSWSELQKIFAPEELKKFSEIFDVSPHGHYEERNILILKEDRSLLNEGQVDTLLRKLHRTRQHRPQPHLDDKIIVFWNGLMIASLAKASQVLDEPRYHQAAINAAKFVLKELCSSGSLQRYWRTKPSRQPAYAEDYAAFIFGLIELYQSDFDSTWLEQALHIQKQLDAQFWDPTLGGYFQENGKDTSLIVRTKQQYDGVVPSSNSLAAYNLLRLYALCGDEQMRTKVEQIFSLYAETLQKNPSSLKFMLVALDYYFDDSKEVAIAAHIEEVRPFLRKIHTQFQPNKVVAVGDQGGIPLLEKKSKLGGLPTFYICHNRRCELPTSDLNQALGEVTKSKIIGVVTR